MLFVGIAVAAVAALIKGDGYWIELPWGWSKVPFLLIFYALGYYCGSYKWDVNENKILLVDVLVISFLISFSVSSIYKASGGMVSNYYGNYVLFYGLAGIGLLCICLIGKCLESSRLVTYIGKNSFLFLCVHPVSVKITSYLTHVFEINYGEVEFLGVIIITIVVVYAMKYFVDFLKGVYAKIKQK